MGRKGQKWRLAQVREAGDTEEEKGGRRPRFCFQRREGGWLPLPGGASKGPTLVGRAVPRVSGKWRVKKLCDQPTVGR